MPVVSVPTVQNGKIPTELLGGGQADATKFLRGDQAWAVPTGGAGSLPFVHAYRELATQSIPALTYTRVNWNAKDADTESEFDLATDRYTAKTAGRRLVVAQVLWTATTDQKLFEIDIYKNGNLFKISVHRASGTAAFSIAISAIIDMAVNDYLEIYVVQNTTGSKSLDMNKATTYLCINGLL